MWPFLFPDDKKYSSPDITHHEKTARSRKKDGRNAPRNPHVKRRVTPRNEEITPPARFDPLTSENDFCAPESPQMAGNFRRRRNA
ncbi:TPA: hypothetical protein JLH98_001014 [Escherichia coli]|nr:hypothetical protein [Escherichia coli]